MNGDDATVVPAANNTTRFYNLGDTDDDDCYNDNCWSVESIPIARIHSST